MVSSAENATPGLTVFYDGSCPLCQAEIDVYRGMKGADSIWWRDVSCAVSPELPPDLDAESAMRRFHVLRPDGTFLSGGRAFAELWFHFPRLRFAGRIFRTGPGGWLIDRAYNLFLPLRPYLQRLARKNKA